MDGELEARFRSRRGQCEGGNWVATPASALLVPAVQKIREAASRLRSGGIDFLLRDEPFSFSGLRLRSGVIAEVGAGHPATVDRVCFSFEGTNRNYVPEPATWALMIAGFGMVGAAMRRQTTSMKLSSTRF